MVYIPLHHKYRPQTFADLVGQSAITRTLSNAIRRSRIAPAYLFCGPRGTGKTSSARILAKSLNCVHGPTPDPCNQCEICISITNGSALDVIEIDAASHTGVDNIRELIERAQFAPVICRYKVYVLDEVHMLTSASFNALLKTLEEPPLHVVFILATTDPQRVLPTVISRCQRFDYQRITLPDMVAHLRMIADQEGIPIETTALELIAQIAQGGLRDAESLLDQLSLLEGTITVDQVWDLIGAIPERDLLGLVKAVTQGDPAQLLTQVRSLLEHGKEPQMVLNNLASFCRDLLLAKTVPQRRDLVTLTESTWIALCTEAQQWSVTSILAVQHHLRTAEPLLRHTSQPRLWLEMTILELLNVTPTAVGVASLQSVAVPEITPVVPPKSAPALPPVPSVATAAVPSPIPVPPVPLPPNSVVASPPLAPAGAVTSQSLASQWSEFLGRLAPIPKARLRLGHIVGEKGNVITVGFPTQGFAENARKVIKEAQTTALNLVGHPVQFEFVMALPGAQSAAATPVPAPPPPISPFSQESSPIIAPSSVPRDPSPPPKSTSALPAGSSAGSSDIEDAARRVAEFFGGKLADLSPEDHRALGYLAPAAIPTVPPVPIPMDTELPIAVTPSARLTVEEVEDEEEIPF